MRMNRNDAPHSAASSSRSPRSRRVNGRPSAPCTSGRAPSGSPARTVLGPARSHQLLHRAARHPQSGKQTPPATAAEPASPGRWRCAAACRPPRARWPLASAQALARRQLAPLEGAES
jgi:hypothetical protein